jgi:hypothetical protein
MSEWWVNAVARSTVRRALASAVLVGPILIAINHGDALVDGNVTRSRVLKMLLTFAVPYAVSTVSSVQAALERRREEKPTVLE